VGQGGLVGIWPRVLDGAMQFDDVTQKSLVISELVRVPPPRKRCQGSVEGGGEGMGCRETAGLVEGSTGKEVPVLWSCSGPELQPLHQWLRPNEAPKQPTVYQHHITRGEEDLKSPDCLVRNGGETRAVQKVRNRERSGDKAAQQQIRHRGQRAAIAWTARAGQDPRQTGN
jgi:hypothetical protein